MIIRLSRQWTQNSTTLYLWLRATDDKPFSSVSLRQEPLNSGDDVSDEEDQELFDTENVVVCQYDKVSRDRYY